MVMVMAKKVHYHVYVSITPRWFYLASQVNCTHKFSRHLCDHSKISWLFMVRNVILVLLGVSYHTNILLTVLDVIPSKESKITLISTEVKIITSSSQRNRDTPLTSGYGPRRSHLGRKWCNLSMHVLHGHYPSAFTWNTLMLSCMLHGTHPALCSCTLAKT
jgi:hypothetical protein